MRTRALVAASLALAGLGLGLGGGRAGAAGAAPGPDLSSALVPGAACLSSQPIRLARGAAFVPNPDGYPSAGSTRKVFGLHAGKPLYGAVQGGRRTAVLPLVCDNNGGTADGQELFSLAVFTVRGATLTPVGLITPAVQLAHQHVTIISAATIGTDRITVPEFVYGSHDGTCCPTGRATTTWSLAGGHLTRTKVSITHRV